MPKSRRSGGSAEMSRPAWNTCPAALDVQAGDGAQQRGLAAAGRPEEADELAGVDVERDLPERGEAAEQLGQIDDAQIRLGRALACARQL